MKKGNGEPVFMLKFAPDLWTSVDFCSEFIGLAVNLDREAVKGVWSSRSHLAKHDIIGELMTALRPALLEDTKQLESLGYTHAQWTKTYAALMETRFCELYACLDGIRRAIYGTYRNIEGVQNQSTQKLFRRAHENRYGSAFPEAIRDTLARAYEEWFPRLAEIRTEVTHGLTGSCFRNPDIDQIMYTHQGLPGGPNRAFVIKDVETEASKLRDRVINLTNEGADHIFSVLEFTEARIVCGFFKGRLYERTLVPNRDLTRDSGTCFSRQWFDKSGEQKCPLASECGAYKE